MEEHLEEEKQVIFETVSGIGDYSKYGFKQMQGGLLFSAYYIKNKLVNKSDVWWKFVVSNFQDIAKCHWIAMYFDSISSGSRSKRIISCLRHLWDQVELDVVLIMVKAILYLYDKSYAEQDIVTTIITKILPDAGFTKKNEHGIYIWLSHKRKNYEGIGNIFVLSYINSGFDRDATWRYIKKNCYLKDGCWHYKNNVAKNRIDETLKKYLMDGGIIVQQINKEFSAFVPLTVLNKDATDFNRVVSKEADGKSYRIEGVASTTSEDLDGEYVSENFIASMKKQAVGLSLKVASHYQSADLNQTVGVVIGKDGDKKTFYIVGKMQPPEENENVKKLLAQMNFGINYGFSIYGRVTKIVRDFDAKTEKTKITLDDGTLSHILITDQPANTDTFASAIVKSIEGMDSAEKRKFVNTFKHTSNVHKDEIDCNTVELDTLPEQAFPINYSTGKIYKEYPHHYISSDNNELYLHKEMVLLSYLKAKKDKAPPAVLEHLRNHLVVIGLTSEVKQFEEMVDKTYDTEKLIGKMSLIVKYIRQFREDVNMIKKEKSSVKTKMEQITPMIDEVADKIHKILDTVEETEETNG